MSDLIGFSSIALVSLLTIFIALRLPDISRILYVALSIRILFIIIGHYIVPLPDSTKDAAGLESLAWTYGQDGFLNAIDNLPVKTRYFWSLIIGILYSLFGRSVLMAQSLSLLLGIGIIFLVWSLAKKIWDKDTAIKVAWIVALFPSLLLYSIVPLKDIYQSFFLLVAFTGIFYWVQDSSYKSIILAMFGFVSASLFHGALIIGGIIFLIIVILEELKKTIKSTLNLRLNVNAFLIIIASIFILQIFFLNKIYIPKIGYFKDINFGVIFSELNARAIGQSSYGNWAKVYGDETFIEYFYKFVLRILYFLFSPFLWDIQKSSHIIGMIDGLIYLVLSYLIIRNIKCIWNDTFLRITFIILFAYCSIFGLGVSNFGAAIRHRTKFIIEMVLLAGPFIPTLVLSNKKKLMNIFKNKS